jgi:hypothetical protein
MNAPNLIILVTAVMLTGCSGRATREDVDGNVESGNVEQVTKRSMGQGPNTDVAPITTMGVIPLKSFTPPSRPVIEGPTTAMTWFYPRKSKNGKSMRDGYWVYSVIVPFEWSMDKAINRDRIPLDTITNVQLDADNNPVIRRERPLEGTGIRHNQDSPNTDNGSLPWTPGTGNNVKTTTVLMNADGTQPKVIQQEGVPEVLKRTDGQIDMQALNEHLKAVQEQSRAIEAARTNSQSSSTAPASSPMSK